ncbi:MAG TPA: phosphatase PAP2 family protein [Bryobacteraceae bacterium]|jgi:acid phosphatase (class A)|nr:phosphatase PAP2 family protein [Bryobacteraceae bacterium]
MKIIALLISTLAFPLYPQPAAPAPGYLAGSSIPDLIHVLPANPAPGSARDNMDRQVFRDTRALLDSDRWKLAQRDDKLSVAAILSAFHCSIGVELKADNAPHLVKLLARVFTDAMNATDPAKDHFQRKRPFLVDEGPICITATPAFAKSFDYPSSHATISWAFALILSEIDPQHATQLLTRARTFGESRVVCGVHDVDAIEAGRLAGSSVVAALHGIQEFRADLEKARAEIGKLHSQSNPAPAGSCASEAALIAISPY